MTAQRDLASRKPRRTYGLILWSSLWLSGAPVARAEDDADAMARARAVLARDLTPWGDSRVGLVCEESVTREEDGREVGRVRWAIRGRLRDPDLAAVVDRPGPDDLRQRRPSKHVRDAEQLYVVQDLNSMWVAQVMGRSAQRLPFEGGIASYLRQLAASPDRPWPELVEAGLLLDVVLDSDRIEVTVPHTAEIPAAVRSGGPHAVMGLLGCRVQFGRFRGRWLPHRVLTLVTARMPGPNAREDGSGWEASGLVDPQDVRLLFLGCVEAAAIAEEAWDDFVEIDGALLPTTARLRRRGMSLRYHVDVTSVSTRPDDVDELFRHAPPEAFGARGRHSDLRTGRTSVVGLTGEEDRAVVESLVAAGARIKAKEGSAGPGSGGAVPESDPAERWGLWTVLAGLLLAVGGVAAVAWHRRSAATRSRQDT